MVLSIGAHLKCFQGHRSTHGISHGGEEHPKRWSCRLLHREAAHSLNTGLVPFRAADKAGPPQCRVGDPAPPLSWELQREARGSSAGARSAWFCRPVPGVPPPSAGMADTTPQPPPLAARGWAGGEGTFQTTDCPDPATAESPVPVRPRPIRLSGGRCVLQLCVWIKSLIKGTRALLPRTFSRR